MDPPCTKRRNRCLLKSTLPRSALHSLRDYYSLVGEFANFLLGQSDVSGLAGRADASTSWRAEVTRNTELTDPSGCCRCAEQYRELIFYALFVAPERGKNPDANGTVRGWRSLGTPDSTPIDFSWEWGRAATAPSGTRSSTWCRTRGRIWTRPTRTRPTPGFRGCVTQE